MDKKFKWNMFMTSFIPLWLTIIVADIWSVIESGIENWLFEDDVFNNIVKICRMNWVSIFVVLTILVLMLISIISINQFLKDKCSNNEPPQIKIKRLQILFLKPFVIQQ